MKTRQLATKEAEQTHLQHSPPLRTTRAVERPARKSNPDKAEI